MARDVGQLLTPTSYALFANFCVYTSTLNTFSSNLSTFKNPKLSNNPKISKLVIGTRNKEK